MKTDIESAFISLVEHHDLDGLREFFKSLDQVTRQALFSATEEYLAVVFQYSCLWKVRADAVTMLGWYAGRDDRYRR